MGVSVASLTTNDRRMSGNHFWNLAVALVKRDVHARYRRTILGPAWAILQPVIYMLAFTFLRRLFNRSTDPLLTFSALVPWTFFANAVNNSGRGIIENAPILKKTAVPREVFPAASVLTALFDFAMASVVLVGMMLWFEVDFGRALLWVPILLFFTATLAFAVSMFIAAFGVYRRDIIIAMPYMIQVWLFLSPVMYEASEVPESAIGLCKLNPMFGLIEGFRSILYRGSPPDLNLLATSCVVVAVVFALGWFTYRKMSRYFADVL